MSDNITVPSRSKRHSSRRPACQARINHQCRSDCSVLKSVKVHQCLCLQAQDLLLGHDPCVVNSRWCSLELTHAACVHLHSLRKIIHDCEDKEPVHDPHIFSRLCACTRCAKNKTTKQNVQSQKVLDHNVILVKELGVLMGPTTLPARYLNKRWRTKVKKVV